MKKTPFKPDTLFIIGLALAVFAAFAPGLSCGFLVNWDDGAHVAINPDIALTAENFAKYFFGTVVDLYIPLPMYSFMLEHALFGDNPFWYHLDNILLHCACTVLFYLTLRRFAVNGTIAFLCACVWAISPQKVESVVWITERKDLLCALFSLVSFYTFMKAFSKDKMSWAAGIFAALAMLCKPAMAALPGVMILYAICLRKNRMKPTEYIRILVFPILASAAALLWSMHVTAGTRPFGLETDIFVPLHNLLWYFMTSFIPYELNPIYPVLEGFKDCVIPLAGTVLLLALLVYGSRKIKMPWILITGFTLAAGGVMVPVAGFMKYGSYQYCDRYTYFASWVLYTWLAVILSKLIRRHVFNIKMTSAALACWGLVFFAATWLYIPSWENDVALSYSVLEKPGPVNMNALRFGMFSGWRSSNPEIMRMTCSKIKKNIEAKCFQSWDCAYLKMLACATEAKTAALSGDKGLAFAEYKRLAESQEMMSALMAGDSECRFMICFDAGIFFHENGMRSSALLFIDEALNFLNEKEGKEKSPNYFTASAVKCELAGDIEGALKWIDRLIAVLPETSPELKAKREFLRQRLEKGK